MSTPGIFKVFDSEPLETRIGVSGDKGTYDIQITGPHYGLDAEVASQPVAGQMFASKMGLFDKCIGIQWGAKGCRYGVCGYAGFYATPPVFDPRFFGVGAYSEDGKNWTTFTAHTNGDIVSIFHMRDPDDKTKNIVVVGGCVNTDGPDLSTSEAKLTTIVGAGPSAGGGNSDGRNVANFGQMGYDRKQKLFYAVAHSGDGATDQALFTFPLGTPSQTQSTSTSNKPSIVWAGNHYPGISPVIDCTAFMTFKDKDGQEHTLELGDQDPLVQLLLDGNNITPSGARNVTSAAAGINDDGDMIIIAVGFHSPSETEDAAIAWWSIEGRDWTEISGIWSGPTELQAAEMASAVPNS